MLNFLKLKKEKNNGIVMPMVLVFGAAFLIIFGGLMLFILLQFRQQDLRIARNEALNIADAGVNFYQWCVNHEIDDCPTEKDYYDANGQLVGHFSLDVNQEMSCGQTIRKTVVSTGWTNKFPETRRKISALFGRPSVAKYSYVVHDSVWAGADRQIRGPYHVNNGVRMDGTNYSLVTSSQSEWVCTSSFDCSPCPTGNGCHISDNKCICPGVFTTTFNSNPGLFEFPKTPFNFEKVTVNLSDLKISASANNSYFRPSIEINSEALGYHMILKENGTYDVKIITDLNEVWAYSLEEGWHSDNFIISAEYLYGTYNISASCGVIFFEDNLWIDGTMKGKATIASANLIEDSGIITNTVINNNITYTTTDGSDAVGIIAQGNMLISPNSPDTMTLRGIFIAQTGRFGRNHYPDNKKTLLETYGVTVSHGRTGTKWTSDGVFSSGYETREDYIDSNLIYSAPPFMPYLSPDFKLVRWQEVK